MKNKKLWDWYGSGGGQHTFSSQYQAVMDYATANGISLPPLATRIEDDLKVRAAVADGSWDDEDLVYYMRDREGYREYAKLNWKSPGNFTLIEVGTLSFDNNGFTGAGAGYLRTQFIASTHAVRYTLNNGSARGHTITQLAAGDYLWGAAAATSTRRLGLLPRNGSNVAAYMVNSTNSATQANSNSYGFFHEKRTASNAVALYLDGASLNSTTTASTALPDRELYLLALNDAGAVFGQASRNIGCFLLGASQNGREVSNNAIWNPSYWDQSLGFTPSNTYLLYMDGQSNSEGQHPLSDLSTERKRKFSNVYIWNNPAETVGGGRWEKLQAGLNNQRSSRLGLNIFGAEIAIADLFETNHPNDVLYISKYAVGASSVAVDGSNPDWNAGSTNENLDIAINNYHVPAKAAIPTSPITDKGLIWMQGEQDATTDANSATATFRTNTSDMLAEFRTGVSNANLLVYICRLNASITRDATRLANIRTAQGTTTGNLTDQGTFANNRFFNTDSYPLLPADIVHFEQDQYGEDLYNELF